MKRDRKSSFDAKEVIERGPELKQKNRSIVIDNGVWEVVMSQLSH